MPDPRRARDVSFTRTRSGSWQSALAISQPISRWKRTSDCRSSTGWISEARLPTPDRETAKIFPPADIVLADENALTSSKAEAERAMYIDIYPYLSQQFYENMTRVAPSLGNIGKRMKSVAEVHDLDARFRAMDRSAITVKSSRCQIHRWKTSPRPNRGLNWPASATIPWPRWSKRTATGSPASSLP